MRLKLMRLEGLPQLVSLKYCQLNTGCGAEKLPYKPDSFSQCTYSMPHHTQLTHRHLFESLHAFFYISYTYPFFPAYLSQCPQNIIHSAFLNSSIHLLLPTASSATSLTLLMSSLFIRVILTCQACHPYQISVQ